MQDYGVPEKAAAIITKYIADTGTDQVFYKPMELLQKISFPRHTPPTTRKNILDHWMSAVGVRLLVPKPNTIYYPCLANLLNFFWLR